MSILESVRRGRTVAATRSTADIDVWSQTYRDALPCAVLAVPATVLRVEREAAVINRTGHCVDVFSGDELALAVAAGIAPRRMVMHDDGITAGPIRRAVMVGVGRFVIGCSGQVSVLASGTRGPQRVLVDTTTEDHRAIAEVLASPRLQLIGLHVQLPSSTSAVRCYADAVGDLIGRMARLRREHGVLLTRLSVTGGMPLSPRPLTRKSLALLDAAIEDAIDDGCAHHRFPRPVLVLSPAAP